MNANAQPFLFVYGTLRQAGNHPMHHLLAQHSSFLGEAWFQGILYRVSWYPCAIPSHYPHDKVIGELYQLHDANFILNPLDDYEECSAHFPTPHEYVRIKQTVYSPNHGAVEAWVYMYNRPINGLERIISGDFFTPRSTS